MMLHQAIGQKEKKITFDAFKTALNIPPGSSDEKVAVVAGGTAGYIWGTDGTNGLIRLNNLAVLGKGCRQCLRYTCS